MAAGLEVEQGQHHYQTRVMEWIDRVRARPGVERGLGYGVPKSEVDQWSEERKASTAKSGATIASNTNIKDSIQ